MAKPVFTCIVFFDGRRPCKYRKVSNIYNLYKYCTNFRNFPEQLTAINVYSSDKIHLQQIRTLKEAYDFYLAYQH